MLARIAARSALADPDVHVRDMAATVLGHIGNRRDIPWLVLALDDPHWFVRCSAAGSLGMLGGPTARRSLIRALARDPNPDVRRWAAGGLAELGDPTLVPTLEAALAEQTDPHVQGAVLRALYELGARPFPALLPLLHDDDFLMRFQALNGLEDALRAQDKEFAVEAVRELLEKEEHPGVRGDAEALLRKLLDTPSAS